MTYRRISLAFFCIAAVALFNCAGDPDSFPDSLTSDNNPATPGQQVAGRIMMRAFILVEDPKARQEVLANQLGLEAIGLAISEDGAAIFYPSGPAAGWHVRVGEQLAVVKPDGTFVIAPPPGTSSLQLTHPNDGRYPVSIPVAVLGSPEAPTDLFLPLPFRGGCGMSPGDEFCGAQSEPEGGLRARAVPTAVTTTAHGTYPAGNDTECVDFDGFLTDQVPFPASVAFASAFPKLAYLGSTCDGYVQAGCCPNENPYSDVEYNLLLSTGASKYLAGPGSGGNYNLSPPLIPAGKEGKRDFSCRRNHKGRVCHQLLPGDLAVDIEGQILKNEDTTTVFVRAGQTVNFVVHNNGCTGLTYMEVDEQEINGTMSGSRLGPRSAGGANGIDHGDAFPNYSVDRDVTYEVPSSASVGAIDVYEFTVDRSTVEVTFQVIGDPTPTPTPTTPPPIPQPSDDKVSAGPGISDTHLIGFSSCPQNLGAFLVSNDSSVTVAFVVDDPPFVQPGVRNFSLEPGGTMMVPVSFECGVENSFSTEVLVHAAGSGIDLTLTVPVEVEVTRR